MSSIRLLIWFVAASSAAPGVFAVPPAASEVTPAPAPALADELSGSAKEDYLLGRALYDDGDFAGALVKFERAFDTSKHPLLLWNMAACEKALRHYGRVMQLLERYEAEAGSRLDSDELARLRSLRSTVRSLVSSVRIRANVSGATVSIDGKPVGTTPLAEPLLVDIGTHVVTIRQRGYRDYTSSRVFTGNQDVAIDAVLEKQSTTARLVVVAKGAQTIRVDQRLTTGSRFQGELEAGTHSVVAEGPDKVPFSSEVVLRAGESRTLDVRLKEEARGIPLGVWLGGGALIAAGLGVGAYFLFRPDDTTADPTIGTAPPGTVQLP
jgi:hypothetical protein